MRSNTVLKIVPDTSIHTQGAVYMHNRQGITSANRGSITVCMFE